MNAITLPRYGPAESALQLEQLDIPTPADEQVLVRVRAASVNAGDWHRMRGMPLLVRTSEGLRTPKARGFGSDAAGVVEEVGSSVTDLQVGDAVFGMRLGAFAEYVAGRTFVAKPTNLGFEESAAIPVAGITALQGLRDKGGLAPGQRVMVTGASGGVGHLAVQIAKALGASHVTGVCGTNNVEMVRALGADEVIDYTREDYTQARGRYDLVLDVGGGRSLRATQRVLTPKGTLVVVGGPGHGWLAPADRLVKGIVLSRFSSRRIVVFIARAAKDDLVTLRELAEGGQLRPVIDRRYPLSETAEAVRYVEGMHTRGKVVITI